MSAKHLQDAVIRIPPRLPRAATAALVGLLATFATVRGADAQSVDPWGAQFQINKTTPAPANGNTTVIERAGDGKIGEPGVKLVALLTADGQQIDQGIVWRVYQLAEPQGKSKLVSEVRQPSPSLKLQPGEYTVNAAFGRANLTKRIVVDTAPPQLVQFVLNAGGLRVNAQVGGKPAPSGAISYAIYSDDRDQFANRTAVMSGAKPNLIIRLNAGIYRIVSTYGDANARVETDVTVEAGKLTEATVAHAAGRANFKLVARAGGEAIPDTAWTIQTSEGEVVKESMGALPSHYLAPGSYSVAARSGGQVYAGKFQVKDGETSVVEVVKDGNVTAEPPPAGALPEAAPTGATPEEPALNFDIKPSFGIKSP
ncbi:MAG: hypothetical protein ACKVP4_04435 [Hyphomicrobium sp.]